MTTLDPDAAIAVAHRAADAGVEAARPAFRTDRPYDTKAGPMDRVTAADRESQRRIVRVLDESTPDVLVVGEEEGTESSIPDDGPAWVVDPIDGTNNYAAGGRTWAVVVAFVVDGEPRAAVVDVAGMGDRYATAAGRKPTRNGEPVEPSDRNDPASFTVCSVFDPAWDVDDDTGGLLEVIRTEFGDLRHDGATQVSLASVADGRVEAAVTPRWLEPWDTIAGVHLVRRAGGRVTDLDGDRWHRGSDGFVASNGKCHDAVVAALDGGGS